MYGAVKVQAGERVTAQIALVGFAEQDHGFLRTLLADPVAPHTQECVWTAQFMADVDAAVVAARRGTVAVILCDRDALPETWQELLERLLRLTDPPPLIVSSRLADDRLWAEALNLGAFDVLGWPFDPTEVARSINLARLHWQNHCLARLEPQPPMLPFYTGARSSLYPD